VILISDHNIVTGKVELFHEKWQRRKKNSVGIPVEFFEERCRSAGALQFEVELEVLFW
jgi:hypothetical protein